MRIAIVTPAAAGTRHGNRITALRWARHLRALGHRVDVLTEWHSGRHDCMIALHALRSHASMRAWKSSLSDRPLVLVLTGTDLYGDIRSHADARQSLAWADRLVVLQAEGLRELDRRTRARTRVIFQSVPPVRRAVPPKHELLVTVIGHLREVKDPFRAALALACLPPASRVRVVQMGAAIGDDMARQARALMRDEPRYRWLAELDHGTTMRWLGRSHVMVISSRTEGGAHVVSEAISAGVPVIASRIPGNVGLLGADYGGYYRFGDERALARMLARAERDPAWLAVLAAAIQRRRALVDAGTEQRALAALLAELHVSGARTPSRK